MKSVFILLLIVSICTKTIATTPHPTIAEKANAVILPSAPLLSESIGLKEALEWVQWMSKNADPFDGTGINIELDGHPLIETNNSKLLTIIPENAITKVKLIDYIKYLTTECNATYTITTNKVIVWSKKESIQQEP